MMSSFFAMKAKGERLCDWSLFSDSDKKFLQARCIAGSFGWTFLILSLLLIPLHLQGILQNTSSFWIAILSTCILKEGPTKLEILCIFGCFAGVLIMLSSKGDDEFHKPFEDTGVYEKIFVPP